MATDDASPASNGLPECLPNLAMASLSASLIWQVEVQRRQHEADSALIREAESAHIREAESAHIREAESAHTIAALRAALSAAQQV